MNQSCSLISDFPKSCDQEPEVSGLDLALGAPGDCAEIRRASVVGDKEWFYSLIAILQAAEKGKKKKK